MWPQRLHEKLGIQEVLVGLSGLLPEPGWVRIFLDGDGVGHLQAEQEVIRGLDDHPLQSPCARGRSSRRKKTCSGCLASRGRHGRVHMSLTDDDRTVA